MRRITVAFYRRKGRSQDWLDPIDVHQFLPFFSALKTEFAPFDIAVDWVEDDSLELEIKGYGDLLNSIRLRAPQAGVGNLCLGHIIGPSRELNLQQDIRRGINRIAFAPETIEPEGSDKVVCHNCGCGC